MRGFLLVLVIGLVLLVVASLRDRQTRRAVDATVGLGVDGLTVRRPAGPDGEQAARLATFREQHPHLDARLADERLASWAATGPATDRLPATAEVAGADVLCCPEGVGGMRELLPSVQRARQAHHRLVVAAPNFDEELLALLCAAPGERVVALLADADGCARLAAATGGRPASRADLQSGAAPTAHGFAARLLSDETGCWVHSSVAETAAEENGEPHREI